MTSDRFDGTSCAALRAVNRSLTALADCRARRPDGHNKLAMLVERARMSFAYLNEQIAGAVLLLSLSLGGCASSNSSLMDARAEAPRLAGNYLPVEDLPRQRAKPEMTVDEQSKLKKQLINMRDHQAAAVKARDSN